MMQAIEAHASSYIREDVHWGCDLDVLHEAVRQVGCTGRYLDLGCGHGFHAVHIAETYRNMAVVGIDLSPSMLEIAEHHAKALALPNVRFVQAEILGYEEAKPYDIISCLNNTLNNLCDDEAAAETIRLHALTRMRKLLRPDGCLVLSVYNKEKLLLENYRRICTILPESEPEKGDLFVEWRNGDQCERHYSHWSTEAEVLALLEQSGFQVELLEKRLARIVVSARRN